MKTRRERIQELLEESLGDGLTAEDIKHRLDEDNLTEREIIEEIKEINKGNEVQIEYCVPECADCDFNSFNKVNPSKCPNCRSRRIKPPKFRI